MDFGLSEDQTLFRDALRGYLAAQLPIERVREIMEGDTGSDATLLESLAAQGVAGVLVPEQYGGTGLGLLDAVVAADELGAAAAPLSFHSSCVMAPLALAEAGTEEQRARWLPAVAAGGCTLAFVADPLTARDGSVAGRALFVPDAQIADAFVVRVRDGDREELALLPRDAPGLRIDPLATVDATRRVSELMLEDVAIEPSMRMPNADNASALIPRLVAAGRIVLAADALGGSQRSLDVAVQYAQDRRQFGRVIGSFQAVKHLCAETVADIEPLRSLLWYSAFAWDEGYPDANSTALLLKAHAAEVATRATTTVIQVFGGMGFTYECDAHIWFKRAGYDRQMLGGPAEMREEAAAILFGADGTAER